MKRIKRKFGFFRGINVVVEGSRRGLCLGWKNGYRVDLGSFNASHIDVTIKGSDTGFDWRLTGFYGTLDGRRTTDS